MDENEIIKNIKQGKIFIYPTDTVYGLGCDAFNENAVSRIKEIKAREGDRPLSVIAPGFDWIKEHLIVDVDLEKYLPGAYTLILKKKNPDFLNWVSSNDSLGVRIPNCDFSKTVEKSGKAFITTSVNLSGEAAAVDLKEIGEEIKNKVDVIIESGGEMSGNPSTLIVDGKEVKR